MVHYRSDDGIHDVPVEKVWKLVDAHTPENIRKIHPNYESARTVEEKGNVSVREYQIRTPEGVETTRIRFTLNRPTGTQMEWLSGSMKGSKCTNTYKAEGPARTRVITEGEFTVQGMDDDSALKIVGDVMDQAFDEDARFLRTLK